MKRLKRGDRCPICGRKIITEDPFILGYLTAVRDLEAREAPRDACGEISPGVERRGRNVISATEEGLLHLYLSGSWDEAMDFWEFKRRFLESGGAMLEGERDDGTHA